MTIDNQTLLQRMIAGASNFVNRNTEIRIQCTRCGEWIRRGDSSPCGSHPVLPSPGEDTDVVKITFVAAPKSQPEPPKVERLGRSSEQRSERWKDTSKPDPIEHIERPPRLTDEELEAERVKEQNALIREHGGLTGKPKRKQENKTEWGMSSSEINRRMDIAESGESDIPDPSNDDIPHCL